MIIEGREFVLAWASVGIHHLSLPFLSSSEVSEYNPYCRKVKVLSCTVVHMKSDRWPVWERERENEILRLELLLWFTVKSFLGLAFLIWGGMQQTVPYCSAVEGLAEHTHPLIQHMCGRIIPGTWDILTNKEELCPHRAFTAVGGANSKLNKYYML